MDLKLDFDKSETPFKVVVAPGELDMGAAPALRADLGQIRASGHLNLVLDLSRAQFIDSTGLGVLVQFHKLLRADGGQMRVVVSQPNIRRILDVTGLAKTLLLYGTLEDALVV